MGRVPASLSMRSLVFVSFFLYVATSSAANGDLNRSRSRKGCRRSIQMANKRGPGHSRLKNIEDVRVGLNSVSKSYVPPPPNFYRHYPPLPFFGNGDAAAYWANAIAASTRERESIIKFGHGEGHSPIGFRANFDKSTVGGTLYGHPKSPNFFGGLLFEKAKFKALNSTLEASGMWFVFRVYSWRHLGIDGGGPHMSVIIGDRVYEVGRPLGVGPSEEAAGPLAMSVDDFLEKSRLESEELGASPGVFLARRFSGVGVEEVKALAEYYETAARNFRRDRKFHYAVNPSRDPGGYNCVTYLTEPLQNPALTKNLNLQRALGAPYFGQTPMEMLLLSRHWAKAFGHPLGYKLSFLFVDGESREFLAPNSTTRESPRAEWQSPIFDDEHPHPQLSRFFMSALVFNVMPLPQ